MKTLTNFKKTFSLACISLALPLALQAEPMSEGGGAAPGMRHGAPGAGLDRPEHGCGRQHAGGPEGHFMGGIPPAMGMPPYLGGINLTEAQRDKLFNLSYAQLPTMREKMKMRMKTAKELRNLSMAETFDDAKAQQLATQLAAIEKDMALARARNDANIFALLTPEQRQKVAENRKRWEERRNEEPVNFKQRRREKAPVNS